MANPFLEEAGPQPPKLLSSPLEIHASLKPLLDNRSPVMIRFGERSQRYQSFLIALDREKGWLALDELIPNDGERLLLQGEAFHLEAFDDGVRIAWSNSQPIHPSEMDGARCYWAPIPSELTYHQRRNAYRAPLQGTPIVTTLGGNKLRNSLEGKLLDISATGCKVSVKGDLRSQLQSGQVYDQLSIRLPNGTVQTAAELRHVTYDERNDMTFCGWSFYRINGLTQRNVERFVYQLQREARRNQAEDSLD